MLPFVRIFQDYTTSLFGMTLRPAVTVLAELIGLVSPWLPPSQHPTGSRKLLEEIVFMPCWVLQPTSSHQHFHFHTLLTWSHFPNSVISFLPLATCTPLSCLFHRDRSIEFLDKRCLLSTITLPSCSKAPDFLMGVHFSLTLSVHTHSELLRVACDSSFTEKSFRDWAGRGTGTISHLLWLLLEDLNCSHLAIIHMGTERDHTHVGAEVRDGEVSPASRCLNLNGVVAEVLPLAFQLPQFFFFLQLKPVGIGASIICYSQQK